jgi:hypothetical protein
MQNIPNSRHSALLKKLCNDFEMLDPFRVKFPNRRDFTFFSKDQTKNSRSRLDFFIISNSLIEKTNKCFIRPCVQNKMFYHRAIVLCFKDPPKVIKQATVSHEILSDPDLELYVGLSIADTYLIHTNAIGAAAKDELSLRIGNAKRDLRLARPDKKYFHDGFRNELEENIRAGRLGGIREFIEDFPFNILQDGGFSDNISDSLFMETLINNLRNEVISYQTFLARTVKESTSSMTKKLLELKADYVGNQAQIDNLQKKLDSIVDSTLRCKLEATSNFEILNNERITPHFLNLAKGSKAEASLSDVRDDNGDPFSSDNKMKEYVHNYYQKLYRKPACEDTIDGDSIKNFLGDEILNSRLVQDSKVPENVRQELEEPISIQELDKSAAQGNRSAAGMDGINNCFIKKFWHYLRIPLHRYVTFCHGTGTLSQSFKTASIKLIPKKRDCSKLKNWRPISLLSCLYKVISRALNNRLKKINGYIFSRAQKGFTKDRHIQEVLMNVIEMIAHCKKNNISGAILSIDQCKVFDSVSHKYMHEVYAFFGLGPNFIRLLETLGNNRKACIAFDDGSHSAEIDLECGRAQGNTSSPIEYNMAQQIIIFKIELCPEVKKIYQNHFIARPYLPDPVVAQEITGLAADEDDPKYRNESAFETSKADGFADDNSTGTLFEYDWLLALKNILMWRSRKILQEYSNLYARYVMRKSAKSL